MKIELTKKEIDKIYFNLIDNIKNLADVDRLHDLNITQQEMYQTELSLIKKFSKL
mgnify:FL=1|tara:strand:- start:288 stop:452 length:165 start_codon:yes stop_codon:yes gene_type:complete